MNNNLDNNLMVLGRYILLVSMIPMIPILLLAQILTINAAGIDSYNKRFSANAQGVQPLESVSAAEGEELEDIMKLMGRIVKMMRKAPASEQILDYAVKLREHIDRASKMPPEDPEDAKYFKEGMEQLIVMADKLVEVSQDGEEAEVETVIKELLSIRKKYHKKLGV